MRTVASGAPFSALAISSMWSGLPTPASTSAGTRPVSRYVLLPVGPVHDDALRAGIRSMKVAGGRQHAADSRQRAVSRAVELQWDSVIHCLLPAAGCRLARCLLPRCLLEIVLHARVHEVAVSEASDQVGAVPGQPSPRSLDRDIVAQLRGGNRAEECRLLRGAVDGKRAELIARARDGAIAAERER